MKTTEETEKEFLFKDTEIGRHRIDLLVEDRVIVELKDDSKRKED